MERPRAGFRSDFALPNASSAEAKLCEITCARWFFHHVILGTHHLREALDAECLRRRAS